MRVHDDGLCAEIGIERQTERFDHLANLLRRDDRQATERRPIQVEPDERQLLIDGLVQIVCGHWEGEPHRQIGGRQAEVAERSSENDPG